MDNDIELQGLQGGTHRAQWIGRPKVLGSNETIRLVLLTLSTAGLQFTWISIRLYRSVFEV